MTGTVVEISADKSKVETLDSLFGRADAFGLRTCARWRMVRAQQNINWAKNDEDGGYGFLMSGGGLDLKPLEEMHECEYSLASLEPKTMKLATELLGVCITVLAAQLEDPETVMGSGPVLEIIRNVKNGLENMPGQTKLVFKTLAHGSGTTE